MSRIPLTDPPPSFDAETDAGAGRLAPGYGRWVHSSSSPDQDTVPSPSADETAEAASRSAGWSIRLVRTEEYERAGDVTAEAYLSSYGGLSDEYVSSLRDVAGRVQDGDVWVAVDADGDILGTVWVARAGKPLADMAQPGETDFRQLAVAPAARGRGIGEALTRHVIDLARERGSHRVVMNSGPEMTGAHALYAKLGFQRLSEREGLWEVQPGRWIELYAFGYDLAPALR